MTLFVRDEKIINELFTAWASDTYAINWEDPDRKAQIRCAITAYSHYVQNLLTEYYDVDLQTEEVALD